MQLKGWHIQNSHFESFHFPYIIKKKRQKPSTKLKRNLLSLRKNMKKEGVGSK